VDLTLLVMTDGREHIWTTLPKALTVLPESRLVIHDDSGCEDVRDRLRREFPQAEVVGATERVGFARSMSRAWAYLSDSNGYIFHLEDDFEFIYHPPVSEMCDLLERWPSLAQVALLRQPVNDEEVDAGSIFALHPGEYRQVWDGVAEWVDHARWFTLNPCLYRADVTRRSWPLGRNSEWTFSRRIYRGSVRGAYWGKLDDPPRVRHIGIRSGHGY